MSLGQKLSTDILVSTAINLSKKVRGIVFIPLITKLLGASAYGVYFQVIIVSTLFAGIFRLGLPSALVHYMQKMDSKYERSELYYSLTMFAVVSGTVVSIVLALTSSTVSRLALGTETYAEVFRIGSLLVPLYIMREMAHNYFRSKMQIKRFSLLDGMKTYLVVGGVLLALLLFNTDLKGVIITMVAVEALFAFVLQGAVYSELGFHPPSLQDSEAYFRYSIPVMVTNFSGNLQSRADRLLIGFFLGPWFVGVYSVAYTVAQLIRMFVLPLRVTLFPELSRLIEEGNEKECSEIITAGTRYFLTLSVPAVAGLSLIRHELLGVLSTAEVVANSRGLVLVLSIGIFFWGLEILYRQLFQASGRTSIVSRVRVAGSLLNLGLNVALIGPFGILGAAIATLVSYAATFGAIYFLVYSVYEINVDYRLAVKILGSTIVMASIVTGLRINGIAITLVVAPLTYFTTLYLIGGIEREDLNFVMNILKI
jgi:O-antigen/teichoic acid export membrane protein